MEKLPGEEAALMLSSFRTTIAVGFSAGLAVVGGLMPASLAWAGPDIPGNTSTTSSINVGDPPRSGTFSPEKDADWYRLKVEAGQDYAVVIKDSGYNYQDTYSSDSSGVALRDSNGAVLLKAKDDDGLYVPFPTAGFEFRGGFDRNSDLKYFIDAHGFKHAKESGNNPTTYKVQITKDCRRNIYTKCHMKPNTYVMGAWLYNWDVDAYRLEVIKGTTYMISIEDINFPADFDGYQLRLVRYFDSGSDYVVDPEYYSYPYGTSAKKNVIYKATKTETLYILSSMFVLGENYFNFPYTLRMNTVK